MEAAKLRPTTSDSESRDMGRAFEGLVESSGRVLVQ